MSDFEIKYINEVRDHDLTKRRLEQERDKSSDLLSKMYLHKCPNCDSLIEDIYVAGSNEDTRTIGTKCIGCDWVFMFGGR